MSERDENRALIAWLEAAKTAIEKAEWQIVNVECKKSREESLADALAAINVAHTAIDTAKLAAIQLRMAEVQEF